jgi:hypothetical protein
MWLLFHRNSFCSQISVELLCVYLEQFILDVLVFPFFISSEGKRPLGRPRHRWEDGIRMDLRETGLGGCGLDSTGLGQGPLAGCYECGNELIGFLRHRVKLVLLA